MDSSVKPGVLAIKRKTRAAESDRQAAANKWRAVCKYLCSELGRDHRVRQRWLPNSPAPAPIVLGLLFTSSTKGSET
jgi:hypothetical protein